MRKIILLSFMMILLISMVSAFEFDNHVSVYNETTETVRIYNCIIGMEGFCLIDGSAIGEAKLLTPKQNTVGVGYMQEPVHIFELHSFSDYSNALKTPKLQDVKNGRKNFQRDFEYRKLSYEEVEIPIYEDNNCYYNDNCVKVQNGTKTKIKEVWTKVTPADLKKNEKVTIGVFVDVREGDRGDWIPQIYGAWVPQWAEWTADLNVDIVTYYTFNESAASTNVEDSLGSNNGTAWANTNTISTNGILNGAFTYDSNGDVVDTGSTFSSLLDKSFSVSFWLNRSATGQHNIIGNFDGAGGIFNLEFLSGNTYRVCTGSTAACDDTGVSGPSVGTWEHVVFTRENGNIKLYTDGTSVWNDTAVDDDWSSGAGNLNIGDDPRETRSFRGVIDEFGIWNRTLTSDEVIQLYNNGTGITYVPVSADNPPVINTPLPANNTNSTDVTINFNATVYDDIDLVNVSLIVDGSVVLTNSSGTNNSLYIFTYTLSADNHTWSIIAYDNSSQSTQTETRDIFIDVITPTIVSVSPIDNFITDQTDINFSILTYDPSGIKNVSLIIDDVSVASNTSGLNNTLYNFTETLTKGSHEWYFIVYNNNNVSSSSTKRDLYILNSPVVNLISPADNSDSPANITFTANSTLEGLGYLQNMSLWTNITGVWQLNETINVSVQIMGVSYDNFTQDQKDGLGAYYNLNELSGPVIDSLQFSNGTNVGATAGVTGINQNAYEFDGTNDYLNVSYSRDFVNVSSVTPTGSNPQQGLAYDGEFMYISGTTEITKHYPGGAEVNASVTATTSLHFGGMVINDGKLYVAESACPPFSTSTVQNITVFNTTTLDKIATYDVSGQFNVCVGAVAYKDGDFYAAESYWDDLNKDYIVRYDENFTFVESYSVDNNCDAGIQGIEYVPSRDKFFYGCHDTQGVWIDTDFSNSSIENQTYPHDLQDIAVFSPNNMLFNDRAADVIWNYTNDWEDTEAYTACLWANPNDTSSGTRQTLMESSPDWTISLEISTNNFLKYSVNSTTYTVVETNITPTENQWFHTCVTAEENGATKMYYNGQFIENSSSTIAGDFAAFEDVKIGAFRTGLLNFFNGTIDEVGIWRRVLNDSEIDDLYDSVLTFSEATKTWNKLISTETIWNVETCSDFGLCSFATSNFTVDVDVTNPSLITNVTSGTIFNIGDNISVDVTATDNFLDTCWYEYNGANNTFNCSSGVLTEVNISFVANNPNATFYANDTSGNINSSFINISVSTLAPVVNITSPVSHYIKLVNGQSLDLNFSVTNITNLDECWYMYNSVNTTVNCLTGNETTFTYVGGEAEITVYSNDTLGNLGFDVQTWTFDISENNVTFNATTFETKTESFVFNISIDPTSVVSVSSILNYNGTRYTSTSGCDTTSCILSTSIDIPLIESGIFESREWFFEVTVFTATSQNQTNTTTQVQNVSRIFFEECNATYVNETLNFTAFDEQTLASVNPFEFNADFNFWLGTGTVLRNNSFLRPSIASIQMCISPANETFMLEGVVEYDEASGANYTVRNYYFQEDEVTNTSQDIPLGLLLSSEATTFILKVQDPDILPLPDALIFTQRFYAGTGQFQTVQVAKTDDNGKSVGFFEAETADYRFIIRKNGVDLLITPDDNRSQKVVGEETPFTLTFTVGVDEGAAWEDFEPAANLTSDLQFNKTTEVVTFSYEDVSGQFTVALLQVFVANGTGSDALICDNNLSQSSGIISCNLSGNSSGNYIAKGIIYRGDTRILAEQRVFTIEDFTTLAGRLGLFLGWFLILISAFAFKYNEIAGIILMNVVMILVNFIGLVNFGITWITAWIAVSIIILVVLER